MSFNYSPKVVNDSSLVMYLDSANTKSYSPSENLLTYSNNFNNSIWSSGNVTILSGATTSPDGTQNATLITQNTVNNRHIFRNNTYPTTISGNSYTLSFFVKPSGTTKFYVEFEWMGGKQSGGNQYAGVWFDLTTKTNYSGNQNFFTPTYVDYSNGWTRVIINGIATTGSTNTINQVFPYVGLLDNSYNISYSGDGVSGAYFYGFQMESNSFATGYNDTTSSPLFRTTWTDLSRGGNKGTLTNGPTYDYSNGGGIVLTNAFNATGSSVTQRVIVPNSSSIQFTTGMSADIWFYANGSTQPSTLPRLLEKGDFYLLIFQTLPSNLSFNVSSIAGGRSITSINSPITNTTRINVTTTYDGQLSKIYINGVLNNTTDWGSVSPISPSSTSLSIGDNFGYNRTFNGTIYSTKLYNRALSAAEVLQNYNTTKSRFGL